MHPNLRLARYDVGDYFAAHYDQADCLTVQAGEGKERHLGAYPNSLTSLMFVKVFCAVHVEA